MDANLVGQLALDMLFYAIMTVFTVQGLKTQIKLLLDKNKEYELPWWLVLILVNGVGIGFSFLLNSQIIIYLWIKPILGLVIGAFAFASYKSALQTILNIIPAIGQKFLGIMGSDVKCKTIGGIDNVHSAKAYQNKL